MSNGLDDTVQLECCDSLNIKYNRLWEGMMNSAALLLIDVQQGLDDPCWGKRNNLDAEDNMALLLSIWRQRKYPIIHIQHNATSPNSPLMKARPGNAFKEVVKPMSGEPIFTKNVNSAFIGTNLEQYLKTQNIQDIVMVGLTTDHCVSTSARMAANLGFRVTLISNATATFDRVSYDGSYFSADEMHNTSLASLQGEFCTVLTTAEFIARVE